MCDFCENIETYDEDKLCCLSCGILYNEVEKKYCVAIQDSEYDFGGDYLEVNYCPLCGRKLSDGKENPSTEELLAKLKEKMTEDDYKTLQNGMKSFADGVNTLWSVLRKGIENDKTEN